MPGTNITTINPLGFMFLALMVLLVFILPRRLAILPIILTACYITLAQNVVVLSLHFSVLRLIVLAGWVRVLVRNEYGQIRIGNIDKAFILWIITAFLTYNLLYGTLQALIYQLGRTYDAVGVYFLFRLLIKDVSDVRRAIKAVAVIIVPLALFMLLEKTTGKNIFYIFGGVPEFTVARYGKLQAQGPFGHQILAGTFGATIMPLCLGLWLEGRDCRGYAVLGLISSTMITFFSGSTGPAMVYVGAIFGWFMWRYRGYLKTLVWGVVGSLVVLDLFVMEDRVWFVIDRVSDLVGASGHAYYRSKLIDETIKRFDEWWLIGIKYTAHWDLTILPAFPDKVDITNQFIKQGIDGGLITMIVFIMLIVTCFRRINMSLKDTERSHEDIILLWAFGVALFTHSLSFLSVVYFDQMVVSWYLLLAMIQSTTVNSIQSKPDGLQNIKTFNIPIKVLS